ncbi:MAG: amidohydrolase family protein [Chthoniobacterales bacterium]
MSLKIPPIFDSHFHIIDPDFPLIENQGYLPEAFSCEQYFEKMQAYECIGGVVVSGSFQGFDQGYLEKALASLGAGFVGVTQIPENVSDARILHLNACGVRGIRFNLRRGGSENLKYLNAMARRVYDLVQWHTELYVDACELAEIDKHIENLPALSIDHLGLSAAGLENLLRLVDRGVRVKASGFGRVDFAISEVLQKIYRRNPQALMFGSDLPSTRAPRPFCDGDVRTICQSFDAVAWRAIFLENAIDFYRLDFSEIEKASISE